MLNLIILAVVMALVKYLPNQKRFSALFVEMFSNRESIKDLFLKILFPEKLSLLLRMQQSLLVPLFWFYTTKVSLVGLILIKPPVVTWY